MVNLSMLEKYVLNSSLKNKIRFLQIPLLDIKSFTLEHSIFFIEALFFTENVGLEKWGGIGLKHLTFSEK